MNRVGVLQRLLATSRPRCIYIKPSLNRWRGVTVMQSEGIYPPQPPVRHYSQLKGFNLMIKGIQNKILHFANSFKLMKNERLIKKIKRSIDPSFSLEVFSSDVTYAFSKLSQLLATRQYRKMKELTYGANDAPITFLQEYLESLVDQECVRHISFKPEDFSVLEPDIVEILAHKDTNAIIVDVAAFAVKVLDASPPVMLHLHVRFCQAYSRSTGSGWLVVDVPFIHITKVSKSR